MNNKILPLFLLPDSKILWRWHAESAARRLLQSAPFAAILTTSPPHSSHLIGRSLARTFGLPWIADFRDAWSGGVVVHEPTRWHRYLQKRIQNRILAAADAVTCVSQGICEELSLHCRQREKFHLLPNGFDPADYPRPQKPADDSSFVFCHCGSITHFSDPLPIFKTLQQMRQLEPDIFQRLKFIFVGYDALGHFAEMITSHRLTDTISYFGYQPHHQALAMLTQADALLLVACHPSNAHFIPGKTYEYLGAKKPILAVSNVADTVQFLQRFPWVTICSPEKPQQLIGAIKKIVMAQKPPIDDDLLRPYDRVYQTQQLAEILHGLIRR